MYLYYIFQVYCHHNIVNLFMPIASDSIRFRYNKCRGLYRMITSYVRYELEFLGMDNARQGYES